MSEADDNSSSAVSHWRPAVDVYEERDRYVITADVPGVEPTEIDVSMENGRLIISGKRMPEQSSQGGAQRLERIHGTFYRQFVLPDTAEPERIEARCNRGVLEVAIPKKEKAKPKRIKVGT